ncbi:hypothetical protein MMC27_001123 [Xylographa pallens]|nr:hypothetical protein [Xylographa pallens]
MSSSPFAVPDLWPLEDRGALTKFNICVHDTGFLTGGEGHRLRVYTEAVAAASSIVRSNPGMLCTPSQKVLVLDAGGSTVDIAVCRVQLSDNIPRFVAIQAIGSIMGVGGINYLMKLERCFRYKLDHGLPAGGLTWTMVQHVVRRELNEPSCIDSALHRLDKPLYYKLPNNISASAGMKKIEPSPYTTFAFFAVISRGAHVFKLRN